VWPPTLTTHRRYGVSLSTTWVTLLPAAVWTTALACGTSPPPSAGRASGAASVMTHADSCLASLVAAVHAAEEGAHWTLSGAS